MTDSLDVLEVSDGVVLRVVERYVTESEARVVTRFSRRNAPPYDGIHEGAVIVTAPAGTLRVGDEWGEA